MSSGTDSRRLFFALDPDEGVRRRIAAVQIRMDLPARRVGADKLHITLAFLGDVASDRIDALEAIGAQLRLPSCRLTLDTSGWFPRSGVVWLGSEAPPAELAAFQSALSTRLAAGGFRSEFRAWVPHVTLYRKMRKPCARMPIEAIEWDVRAFSLVQSTLGRTGPVYAELARWMATA
jgi:2'-5' RNA ligase